jgi:hypothetical protein
MYCPQCSQEQASEEMRFCSRCGFPLAVVSQLVANGGALAGFDSEGKRQLSPRQRGIRWGGLLMIISGVLVPIVALLTAMKSDLVVLFLPVILILIVGLARLLHAYLLQPGTSAPNRFTAGMSGQLNTGHRSALPPGQSIPITNWGQPIDTSDMAQPASVTDNTTKLLNEEVDEH